jgi:HK97 family phage major capsid protein
MSDAQTIEIDEAVINEVAQKATAAVEKSLDERLKAFTMPTADEIVEKLAEKNEKTEKKNIHDDGQRQVEKTDFSKLPKEVRFTKGLIAHLKNDSRGLAEYNDYVGKAWQEVSKANYQNVTTTADGGALVPDPEFIAEVERLTDDYGVASRLADVRRTDRDSVTMLSGTNEISFTRTSEATAVNAQKLTYAAATVALDKYIATLVMTSEIVEDSAIDLFADATAAIAEARAKLFDQLVFTDSTYGLLYQPDAGEGWKTVTVGSALSDFDFDDAMDAPYKVVSKVRRQGRFFMHPTVWNELRQKKSGDGTNSSALYYAGSPLEGVTPTIDNYPVELVDVLPAAGEITANEPFAVFGDLKRVKIHVKRLLETKVFDSGVVKDAGGTDINLITQDAWAMRATLRAVPQTRFPGAFVIIGTGTVS